MIRTINWNEKRETLSPRLKNWSVIARDLDRIQEQRKALEKQEIKLKKELHKACDGKPYTDGTYVYSSVIRKGSIDKDKLIEELDIDIDRYRKEDMVVWSFKRLQ